MGEKGPVLREFSAAQFVLPCLFFEKVSVFLYLNILIIFSSAMKFFSKKSLAVDITSSSSD